MLSNTKASIEKKAYQCVYFRRRLKCTGFGISVLTSVHRCVVEGVLASCITVCYGNCSAVDRMALQWVVGFAQQIIDSSLPLISEIYFSMFRNKACCIMKDSPHPVNGPFPPSPQAGGCASGPEPPS